MITVRGAMGLASNTPLDRSVARLSPDVVFLFDAQGPQSSAKYLFKTMKTSSLVLFIVVSKEE
jgi:hypothetical protein